MSKKKTIVVVGMSGAGKSVFTYICDKALKNLDDKAVRFNSQVLWGTDLLGEIGVYLDSDSPEPLRTDPGCGFKKENYIALEVTKMTKRWFWWNKQSLVLQFWELSGESYDKYLNEETTLPWLEKVYGEKEYVKYLDKQARYLDSVFAGKTGQEPAKPDDSENHFLTKQGLDLLCIDYYLRRAKGVILLLEPEVFAPEALTPTAPTPVTPTPVTPWRVTPTPVHQYEYFVNNLVKALRMQRGLIDRSGNTRPVGIPIAVVFTRDDEHKLAIRSEDGGKGGVISWLDENRHGSNALNSIWTLLNDDSYATTTRCGAVTSFGYGNMNPSNRMRPKGPLQPKGFIALFDWLTSNMR